MDDALYRQQDGLLSGGQVFSFRKQDKGFCLHLDFWKVSGSFWKQQRKMNERFTLWVENLRTWWVNALLTHGVNAQFTLVVDALFTQGVDALFTQVVDALFTQVVDAFWGKKAMEMPKNKPLFFAVFQNRTRAGRKNRKNKAVGKSNVSANQQQSLLSVNRRHGAWVSP